MLLRHRIAHQRSHMYSKEQKVLNEGEFSNTVRAEQKKLLKSKRFTLHQLETVMHTKLSPLGSCSSRLRKKLTHQGSSGSDKQTALMDQEVLMNLQY